MFSTDTEATGIDIVHGAKPFIVSFGLKGDKVQSYVWDVNPETRQPLWNAADWYAIAKQLAKDEDNIFQNAKFDLRLLTHHDPTKSIRIKWGRVHDILFSAHLLRSLQPRDLTTQTAAWLNTDISYLEQDLLKAVNEARNIAKRKFPEWRIAAKTGLPEMPGAKGEKRLAHFDYWLPRAVAKALKYRKSHPWWDIALLYNRADCVVTRHLRLAHLAELEERGLTKVYEERRKQIRVVYDMERTGITFNYERRNELYNQYKEESDYNARVCINLSGGNLKKMPAGRSNALNETLFGYFGLVSNKFSKKTGAPKADKEVIEYWKDTLPRRSKARTFVCNLGEYRQRTTAMSYMNSYGRFGVPALQIKKLARIWRRLFPSLNTTATDTLRGASQNPNQQNISKKPGFNLRYLFGPLPGEEWWALDYENIELRIPAYEANETEMVELFEHPERPPYFGSNHLLVAHVLHPEEFERCLREGTSFKDLYKATLYQWTKNGNFAVQYGAIEESGTADRAYHVKGAQRRIKSRFRKIAALNESCIEYAQEHGYVWTMVDKTIGSGYPLECEFTRNGRVKPTIPLNYHIQGTAMWCMNKAMVRCYNYLRKNCPEAKIIMQVHDELVFRFPKGVGHLHTPKLRKLMEMSGEDIGIPLRVSVAYHPNNYSKEEEHPALAL